MADTAEISFDELTSSTTIRRVVSQIKQPNNRFQKFYGMGIGGAHVTSPGGEQLGWDIFNNTRTIARGRTRASGPGTTHGQRIGHVSAQSYRAHDKIHIEQSRLFRRRPLGQNWGNVDQRGQSYLTRQEAFMAQRYANNREFMISRMFRGGFGVLQDGDDLIPVEKTGGTFDVDFQVPAGNLGVGPDKMGTGTGDIISASFDLAGTNIFQAHMDIDAASEKLSGYQIQNFWINSATASYYFQNTSLLDTVKGTANVLFNNFGYEGTKRPDGTETTDKIIIFKALPFLTFHIYDAVLDVNGTETNILPDGALLGTPDPSSDWAEWMEGSEIVAENVMDPGTERYGFHPWLERTTQPAGWDLIGVDNGLPALYIPNSVVYFDVDG